MCVEKIMIMFSLIKNGICFMTRGDILRWFILIKLAKNYILFRYSFESQSIVQKKI